MVKETKGRKMKKSLSVLSALALGACVYGTPVNNEGFYTEMDLTTVDWSAVNKSGSSCQTNLFFLIPMGDNSVPTAIKDAKINKLSYVDTDYTLYFPIMSRECTNVWGVGHDDPVFTLPEIPTTPDVKSETKADKKTEAKKSK